MEFFTIVLFVFIAYLLYLLSKPNAFDRTLKSKGYTLHFSNSMRVHGLVTITFDQTPTSDIFRKALYDCMYSFPSVKSLSFENLGRQSIFCYSFEQFEFECLDFSKIPAADFNCLEPFTLPARYIILPADATSVPLLSCHPNLERIAIPSRQFVPACKYITFSPESPTQVDPDFRILVPSHLLNAYRNDPVWNSIQFSDHDGNIFYPAFYPYPGI